MRYLYSAGSLAIVTPRSSVHCTFHLVVAAVNNEWKSRSGARPWQRGRIARARARRCSKPRRLARSSPHVVLFANEF